MDELTDEQLKELHELRAALEGEFAENEEVKSRKSAKKDIEELKEDFLDALTHVVKHSVNDTLRAKVAMWGYEKLLDEGKAGVDPIHALIAGMPPPAGMKRDVKALENQPSKEAEARAVDIPVEVLEDSEPDE